MIGGNFVNWFNISGPQLQSDPAGAADRSAECGSARQHARDRAEQSARAPEHDLRPFKNRTGAAFAQSYAAAQRRDDRWACRRGGLDAALKFLEDESATNPAERLYHRLHRRIAPACARKEANFCRRLRSPSFSSSWCWPRSSTASAIHSSFCSARSRWLCSAR